MTAHELRQMLRGSAPDTPVVLYLTDPEREVPLALRKIEYGGAIILQPYPQREDPQ